MSALKKLQSRIKYSRLYKTDKVERLYIKFGLNNSTIKTSAWFEVVNDNLCIFVRVEDIRNAELYDYNLSETYKREIRNQFREIIEDCELERKETPLHVRLKDNIIPVYDDLSLRHQVEALRFCCSMKVSALYSDTGTGKSKIAIDVACSRFEAGQIKKVLVFLPVSTKSNFMRQVEMWSKCSKLEWKLVGHESISGSDRVYIETIQYVNSETFIIVDESHEIKNPIAKRSKRIKQICEKTSYKIVMTGTPVTNNIHDLYMQYAVLSPYIIGVRDWKKFEEKYLIMGGQFGDEIIGYKNADHLMGLLEPYTYQIDKNDCLDLPAKQFHTHTCYLSDEQWEAYRVEKEMLLEKINSEDFTSTDIFQAFTRMQMICSGYIREPDGEIRMLLTYKYGLINSIPDNEKIVFFCKYLIEVSGLVDHFGRDKCSVFTGENRKTRDQELDDFVNGEKKYFIATMQTGGTGLNGLQDVCKRVVFFSNSFSYFIRKQSIGRIDRHGQKYSMDIHDFKTEANIDDKIMRNLRGKGNLADEIKKMMLDKTKLKEYISDL